MYDKLKQWLVDHPKWAGLVVTVEGAVAGAVASIIDDYFTGAYTLNRAGLIKMGGFVAAAVVVAVRNWLKPAPVKSDAK